MIQYNLQAGLQNNNIEGGKDEINWNNKKGRRTWKSCYTKLAQKQVKKF